MQPEVTTFVLCIVVIRGSC